MYFMVIKIDQGYSGFVAVVIKLFIFFVCEI